MSLISHNLMAFYPIWVGFLLQIIILIGVAEKTPISDHRVIV